MCNNVIYLFLFILLTQSSEHFRLFSSDTGTYKEARPFFTSSKRLIDDYFDGNLAHVSKIINSHTFVFVMYYANFCGISRRMRDPYEKAATFYRERLHHGNNTFDKFHVKFIAVDCFHHDGQCRKTYKLNYYPHMFLYIKGIRGYQYFGPTKVTNLIEFIEKIRMPVIRLTSVNDFLDFIVQYESNVLAHFDFSNDLQRYYYSLYTQAALKHIEYDNEHPIRFALILNESIMEELSTLYNRSFQSPFVILHRLGSLPQAFPNMTNNFTVENLFQWVVNEHKDPYVGWIVPKNLYYSHSPSIDKATLFDALTDHDNLLIFLTSNKLDELKLRHIYFYLSNCNITHSSLWLKQIEQLYNHSINDRTENLTKTQRHLFSSCCQHAFNHISTTDIYNLCLSNHPFSSFKLTDRQAKLCLPVLNNSTLQKLCFQDYCRQWLKNSTLFYQQNSNSHNEILLGKRREKFHEQFSQISQSKMIDEHHSIEKYEGLLCRMNSTWTFRLINSRDYPNFGQNIGVVNQSRIILVLQPKNEQYYVLNNNEITTENIYNLIYDISHNLRSRAYTTVSTNQTATQYSNRLIELTTDTFSSIVFDSDKHVLVVYYTKWCGFCQSIWPVLFQTKQFFHQFTDLLFTRIQADKHDLPWHLTAYNYPTLILFPAKRKNHSIVYPTSTNSLTSVSLIRFLLDHLYIADDHVNEPWCQQTNNSFLSMLSSTYIDFSQLSYLVKSFS